MQAAPEERRKWVGNPMDEMFRKWQRAGARFVAGISCASHPGGFAHHAIFEVESLDQVEKMHTNILIGKVRRWLEGFDFHVGMTMVDPAWQTRRAPKAAKA